MICDCLLLETFRFFVLSTICFLLSPKAFWFVFSNIFPIKCEKQRKKRKSPLLTLVAIKNALYFKCSCWRLWWWNRAAITQQHVAPQAIAMCHLFYTTVRVTVVAIEFQQKYKSNICCVKRYLGNHYCCMDTNGACLLRARLMLQTTRTY